MTLNGSRDTGACSDHEPAASVQCSTLKLAMFESSAIHSDAGLSNVNVHGERVAEAWMPGRAAGATAVDGRPTPIVKIVFQPASRELSEPYSWPA